MLIGCVIVYMAITVGIGIYASSRVKDSADFMVAGRSLPLYMNFACVFATWFGAETLLSVSAKFAHKGLSHVSGDPFGASMCLVLVAFFFARTFYRMELLTIGDYYHARYGKLVEIVTSLGIAASYLGWTSAQLSALGLVIDKLFPQFDLTQSILIGAAIVTVYTLFGGMWAVALTDVVQTAAIALGLIIVATLLANMAGGFDVVVAAAHREGKLNLLPEFKAAAWLTFVGEFITMSLGSIPQQDVFQRVTSAKNEKTAFLGTLGGAMFYFSFAFVPMFIAISATVIDPAYVQLFEQEDVRKVQQILPTLVLDKTPIWCQVLFFGALLSAILSTASGTLLAPASLLTENVLQPFIKHLDEKSMLWVLRSLLVIVAVISTTISVNTDKTMYELVESGYSVTLVVAFVPLICGIYWKRASTQAAIFSIVLAVTVWLGTKYFQDTKKAELTEAAKAVAAEIEKNQPNAESKNAELEVEFPLWTEFPPQLCGLIASLIGMFAGGMLPQWIRQKHPSPEHLARRKGTAMGH
jgi:solute:Na+ symporter, SSS family